LNGVQWRSGSTLAFFISPICCRCSFYTFDIPKSHVFILYFLCLPALFFMRGLKEKSIARKLSKCHLDIRFPQQQKPVKEPKQTIVKHKLPRTHIPATKYATMWHVIPPLHKYVS